ncbi:O-antigen ligase [Capnocytophaga sp.]|uniref:O-antigen ligase family protein n=1 Tax=Capnocytophaga sp. TaxID=44737 RepID=UPI0026DBE99A|nr:O-antigen ligase family protein [Capnocytophaga sp.]
MRNRLPLLGLGVVGFLGLNKHHKLSYYLHTLLVTSLVAIGFLIFGKIGFWNFISSENRTLLFTTARIEFINSHMMFNLYLNVTLVAIWYLLSNRYKTLSTVQKMGYIVSYALIFFILLISEGRSGLLMSLFITGGILFLEIYKRSKIWTLGLTGLFAIFIIFRLTYHPRISSEKVSQEPRLFLWENAFSLIKEKPIIGWGANDAQHQFTNQIWFDTTGFVQTFWRPSDFVDTHNQFVQSYLEFGIVGFTLLLAIYLSPYFIADTSRKTFCLLLLIISVFQSMFDMFITGQFASIFVLISFMVLWAKNDVKPTNDLSTP